MDNTHHEEQKTDELQQCISQLTEIKTKYTHLVADFDNFKKRQEKERQQWSRIAQIELLLPLLNFVDDFNRAIEQHIQQTEADWFKGFQLLHKELQKYLEKSGIETIKVTPNEELNPELHESIMSVQSSTISSGHIVDVLQNGYLFKGQLVRPARVSIAQ